ncbi:MAG: hypothetical protein JWP07_541, partial [Pseudonocardiales bacterium]|nr:hypothetical protein [Pseudonocardiales bacterium]
MHVLVPTEGDSVRLGDRIVGPR